MVSLAFDSHASEERMQTIERPFRRLRRISGLNIVHPGVVAGVMSSLAGISIPSNPAAAY
jgi:hypothetical protein